MAKCKDCGFLTFKTWAGQFVEVNKECRDLCSKSALPNFTNIRDDPICFILAYDLRNEWDNQPTIFHDDGSLNSTEMLSVLLIKERKCPPSNNIWGFVDYQQGLTPKEHRDMLDRKWMLEQEEKRRKSDRFWHYIELAITLVVGAIIALVAASIGKG